MTDLTSEEVRELATIVRENSLGTIPEESEHIHMTLSGDRLEILGPGWYLSVVATHHEGGIEHARMALVSLAGGLGRLLASGEYEENILRSQGKTYEAGVARLMRLHRNATVDLRFASGDDYPHVQGYIEGLQQALKVMGEHVE
jgi:hypothetical protein